MKIAFCIENFIIARGGAERYVNDLSYLLSDDEHEVHIFTLKSRRQSRGNLHIHVIKCLPIPRFFKTICFALRCWKEVRSGRFDIVHSFGRTWGMDVFQPLGGSQMGGLVGNLRSIDNFFSKMLKIMTYIFSLRRIVYFLVEKIQIKEARIVIAISAMVKNDLIRYCRLSPQKVKVVRNGIDLEKFHPHNRRFYRKEIRLSLGLTGEDIFIIFVAHNFRLKGLRSLLQALALLNNRDPENHFVVGVFGSGKVKQFTSFSRKRGVRDKCKFISSNKEIQRYYAAADICVHPSYYDPSALVVLEAMASGLPVITTSYCGTSEIIKDGREGFVVRTPADFTELADRITRLNDAELRRKMGEAGRRRAEEFPYSRNIKEILDIYDEYIDSRSR
ncbi:MAG: glycosyltransferase family 4 protein [Candidatus Euphemobacter frigidus]|nr:glycosyltransferase family 4 protein [Candidatus Euphemobacter frigidus]MDP8275174.1 glycosyltransferase family 4 protein [Candidatus Euphemobacter frigidus]